MTGKRCYNKTEATQYFGIDIDAFETYIEPELEGKGIVIGNCLVYEAREIGGAWDDFKKKQSATLPCRVAQRRGNLKPQSKRLEHH
jgi:hypothetical protein